MGGAGRGLSRRRAAVAGVVAVGLAIAPAVAASAADDVTTFTFDASVQGWEATDPASAVRVDDVYHGASGGSLYVTGGAPDGGGARSSSLGDAPNGGTVAVDYWSRSFNSVYQRVCVTWSGGSDCDAEQYLGKTWTERAFTGTVPAGATGVRVRVQTGQAVVDDVQATVRLAAAPAPATPAPTASDTAAPSPAPTVTVTADPAPAPAPVVSGAVSITGPVELVPEQWNGLALIVLAAASLVLFLLAIMASKTLFGR